MAEGHITVTVNARADQVQALVDQLTQAKAELLWFRSRVRPIYRPGHPRIEWYIDGQRVGWGTTLDDAMADAMKGAQS